MDRPLHPDDIVAKTSDETQLAVVERTCGDIDTHVPFPNHNREPITHDPSISAAAFRRFMMEGIPPKDTVLVRLRDETKMELLPLHKVKLIDRSLLIGDIVKRAPRDAMSGVILQTSTTCSLQPMCDVTYQNTQKIKGLPPPSFDTSQFWVWPHDRPEIITGVPAEELKYAESPSVDDLVVYQDWIGRVDLITSNIHIKLLDNCVVEIPSEYGEHVDGSVGEFVIGDVAKTKKGTLRRGRWVFGQYNANTSPVGTVVEVHVAGAEIAWLQKRIGSLDEEEPSSVLEFAEIDSSDFQVYDRTRRPVQRNSNTSPRTISNSEIDVRLDLRVRFKDLTGACVKYNTPSHPNRIPRLDRMDHLGYDLNVFDVVTFTTEVVVQWQDLSITTERSIDLVPDGSIDDEHAAWPGEIAQSLTLRPVPGMENVEQPEKVGVVHSVNAAERMAKVKWCPSSTSYIHYSQEPDGELDLRPVLGHSIRSPTVEEEVSLYDIEAPAALNVRRGDIVLIANTTNRSTRPAEADWLGEVVDTPLDGTLVVRLGAASEVRDVVLLRHEAVVAVRSDGTGDPADPWHEDEMDEDEEYSDDEEDSIEGWDSGDEELMARYENENGEPMDEEDVENEDWESADEDEEMHDAPEHQTPPTSQSVTPTDINDAAVNGTSQPAPGPKTEGMDGPPSYLILEGEPPLDHHFASEPSTTSSNHMKRTQKEHKILRNPSTLPSGVYIRSYETRLDLLRVLLIGPTETPYENAPFVIDVYLPPSFPAEPPAAYFHSWPAHASIGALGRANPNLYEDGKICLSLLGTWEGNKGEGWSAARSTLLQVIVSLLGLVLVREPYYNEAGYETLMGTEASKRPSALYSERIFLRAKGFLITALSSTASTSGLKGLADVVEWLYKDAGGPKLLDATIKNVEEVLQRSDGTSEPDGLTIMSKGACVSLKRVLDRLNELKAKI